MKRAVLVAVLLAACGPGVKGGPSINQHMGSPPPEIAKESDSPVVSHDILAREPLANTTHVKHILIGWKDLGEAYDGHQDARGAKRTKAEAEGQINAIMGQLGAGGDFEALMKQYSEDAGSTAQNKTMEVTPEARLVIEFRQLALRLKVGEYGVCQSDFGFHIIKRYE